MMSGAAKICGLQALLDGGGTCERYMNKTLRAAAVTSHNYQY